MSKLFEYLQQEPNAVVTDRVIEHFGDPFAEYASAQCGDSKALLHSLGILRFSGSDARPFINGQCTTNCDDLSPQNSQLSAWCDPKGRVLYLFVLFTDGDNIYAVLPTAQMERFAKRMRMYVLRADVTIEDVTSELAIIGATTSATIEDVAWHVETHTQGHFTLRYGSGRPRFLHIVPAADAREYFDAMNGPAVGEHAWKALDSVAAIPRIDEHSSGQYLPQNLNLDCMDALSFSKGCFPGQEIIARLKYRGTVKKRLISGTCLNHESLLPQTPINVEGRGVGHVLFASAISSNQAMLTAITEVDASANSFCIEGVGNIEFVPTASPYPIAE